jgi:hypothetical protein
LAKDNMGVPRQRIDAAIGVLIAALSSESPHEVHIVRLPVLFKKMQPHSAVWLAYTSNVVNCLVAEGKVVMSDTRGPNPQDEFRAHIEDVLSGIAQPEFVDAWDLHMVQGEVHCASNALRTPLDEEWWKAWSGE